MLLENVTFSPIPEATSGRPEAPLYLRLTPGELELLKSALDAGRRNLIGDIGRVHHTGTSAQAIDLCRRRSAIEDLLERMTAIHQPRPVDLPERCRETPRLSAAAARAA